MKPSEEHVRKRKTWLMISKADDNSTKMETENCLLDLAILRFLGTLKIVTSMEWVYVETSLEGVQQKMKRMKLETVTLNRLFALFPLNSAWKWIIMKWRGHFFSFFCRIYIVYISEQKDMWGGYISGFSILGYHEVAA